MIAWLLPAAWAAQLSLEAPTTALEVGQTIELQLQLIDGSYRGAPDIPTSKGLSVRYRGQSTSQVIVNFDRTRVVRYAYAVTAATAGRQTAGPVVLVVDGEPITAPAIEFHVAARSSQTSPVKSSLSDTDPFLGEVVLYNFRLEAPGSVVDLEWTRPSFDGFVAEQLAEPRQSRYQVGGDTPRTVQEIAIPLVAAGAGDRVVTPAVIQVHRPASGGRRTRGFDRILGLQPVERSTYTSLPVHVRVRELPKKGQPPNFSGLVGTFELEGKASTRSVPLGEAVTWTVRLSGDGVLQGWKLPPLNVEGVRAYDDEPVIQAEVTPDGYQANAVFKRAIVPGSLGTTQIPPHEIVVFDPEAEQYVTLRTEPLSIEVTEGEADGGELSSYSAGQLDSRDEVETLGEDILPAPGQARVRNHSTQSSITPSLISLATPLFALGAWGMVHLGTRRREDPWAVLAGRLAQLPDSPADRLAALESIFREAAGLRLGRPAPGLDQATIATLGDSAKELLSGIERARYGGDAADLSQLETAVRAFLGQR